MNLDGPYLKENFTFPRFKDLKYYEPLLEVQLEDSILTVPSLGGLGFVSTVKVYKNKGYYLRYCAKIVGSGVLNKVQPGFLMGVNHRASFCPLEKDLNVKLEYHSRALKAV